jgi:hypothetical protein
VYLLLLPNADDGNVNVFCAGLVIPAPDNSLNEPSTCAFLLLLPFANQIYKLICEVDYTATVFNLPFLQKLSLCAASSQAI